MTKLRKEQLDPVDHNDLINKGTKTHDEIEAELARLANTSGTNTGDQTDISGNAATADKAKGLLIDATDVSFYKAAGGYFHLGRWAYDWTGQEMSL